MALCRGERTTGAGDHRTCSADDNHVQSFLSGGLNDEENEVNLLDQASQQPNSSNRLKMAVIIPHHV